MLVLVIVVASSSPPKTANEKQEKARDTGSCSFIGYKLSVKVEPHM